MIRFKVVAGLVPYGAAPVSIDPATVLHRDQPTDTV
jgi:hypothetical protein